MSACAFVCRQWLFRPGLTPRVWRGAEEPECWRRVCGAIPAKGGAAPLTPRVWRGTEEELGRGCSQPVLLFADNDCPDQRVWNALISGVAVLTLPGSCGFDGTR